MFVDIIYCFQLFSIVNYFNLYICFLYKNKLDKKLLKKAFELITVARSMSDLFEKEKSITSTYVHATSKGHETAI